MNVLLTNLAVTFNFFMSGVSVRAIDMPDLMERVLPPINIDSPHLVRRDPITNEISITCNPNYEGDVLHLIP